ncbi:glycosyltransferase 87 family protein [Gordonia aurantiaca]|uniref:glycosyltransferase 87 family protein n=1 Tax=Gordonia sp. B21 TaxID=3151852 RepID=UPI0032645D34
MLTLLRGRWGHTVAYAVFFVTASIMFAVTELSTHLLWAACAAIGYGVSLATSVVPVPRRAEPWRARAAFVMAMCGALVVPLALLLTGRYGVQNEVTIIEQSADVLLSTGTPYVHDASSLDQINPYLPGMALFGVPAAVGGMVGEGVGHAWSALTDPRIWCLLVAVVSIATALRLHGVRSLRARAAMCLSLLSPTVALEMSTSGVDIPLAGLLVLGLALAGAARPKTAGVAVGAALALKWVAVIAVPVAALLILAREGRRRVVAFLVACTVTFGALLTPALGSVVDMVAQVVKFPAGVGVVATPARSPMPGVLLASTGGGGRLGALVLLAIAAAAIAVLVIRRPPETLARAYVYAGLGFVALFLLAPTGRFGYMVIPVMLFGAAYATSQFGNRKEGANPPAGLEGLARRLAGYRVAERSRLLSAHVKSDTA